MAVRWAAAAFLEAETGYRRIMGYRDLWILKAHLDELTTPSSFEGRRSPLSMNRPGATATSNYGWDTLVGDGDTLSPPTPSRLPSPLQCRRLRQRKGCAL